MIPLPSQIHTALSLLDAAGHEVYVVGGAVRNHVMGLPAKDWDITTSALPREVKEVFRGFRLIETGLKHGTVTVLVDSEPIEITTFRVDGSYTDHRRPDRVQFTGTLQEDLARRDFTINALAYHPQKGITDYYGGVDDIRAGILRCVGEPDRRFREDGLRMLRGLRFASVFDLTIHRETAEAIHRNRELLGHIAAERIRGELTKLLCGPSAGKILARFRDVAAICIPELAPMFDFFQHNPHHDRDVWTHTLAAVDSIPPDPVLRWAALLHDVGKPGCFSIESDGLGHFYGHAQRSTMLADEILSRLRFDNDSRKQITTLIRYHDLPIPPERKPVRRLINKLGEDTVRQLILLHIADTMGQSEICRGRIGEYELTARTLEEVLREESCFSLKDLAVNGNDMLALGLRGRAIGQALDRCLNGVMEELVPNEKDALLAYLRQR